MFNKVSIFIILLSISTCDDSFLIDSIINKMTIKEKIGQMIMVRVRSDFYSDDNYLKKEIDNWIKEYKVGGLITFDGNGNVHGMYNNHKYFQSISEIPLLIASDLERGAGQQMAGATLFPSNMAVAATSNTNNAYLQGKITASEAKQLGIHMILAPVLDVNNNPKNPIINFRSYSDSPEIVSNYGIEFIKGIQDNGLYACAKHFPGHGNTSIDSHTSLPTINSSINELNKVELYPFLQSIKNDVKMIMIGHIAMPALDETLKPSSHSYEITTKLLKEKWNYKGLIITDGMEMGGVTKEAWSGESAIRAINAGSDIILLPIDLERTINSIVDAIVNGKISEDRINHSLQKILKAKIDLNLFNFKFNYNSLKKNIGSKQNKIIAENIAASSITLVKDKLNLIPIRPEKHKNIIHVILSTDDNANQTLKTFRSNVRYTHANVKELYVNYETSDLLIDEIIKKLSGYEHILVSLLVKIRMNKGESTINSSHLKLIDKINKLTIPSVFVSFGSPYLNNYDLIDTYICTYGYGNISQKAASNAIFGRTSINGKLPIKLNNEYKRGHGLNKMKISNMFDIDNTYDFSSSWKIIDLAIEKKIFPGAQIMVLKDNKILANKNFGKFTYSEDSKIVNKNTIFDIASLTKVVATTPVVMTLIKKKILNLEHEVNQFYPSFNGKWKENVTIRHLLNHTSGIKSYSQFFNNVEYNNKGSIINVILNEELKFEPGTATEYSDLGMILLMDICEKVSGLKFDKMVQNWVLKPIEMNNTFFNPDISKLMNIPPTEIDSVYRKKIIKGIVHDENAYHMGGISGHSGLFSNAYDIAKYAQTTLNLGIYNGKRVFDKRLVKKFTKGTNISSKFPFILGWDTPSKDGKSNAGDLFSDYSFGHLGFTGTSLWIDAKNNIVIVFLSNRTYPTRNKKGIYNVRRSFHNEVMNTILSKG